MRESGRERESGEMKREGWRRKEKYLTLAIIPIFYTTFNAFSTPRSFLIMKLINSVARFWFISHSTIW